MSIYAACDLGGTNIKAGLVDIKKGEVLLSESTPAIAHQGSDAVLKRMADLIQELIQKSGIAKAHIKGLGVSAPGMLDLEKGISLFLTNLPGKWRNVPMSDILQGYLELPVSILNDARAITLGEFTFGAGRGVDSMACLAIGTGIGGGLVIDGKLVLGISGMAGEIGHHTIDIHGVRCGCGNYGCLETYATGPAIASMAERAVRQGMTTSIGKLVDHDLNQITSKVVAQAANEGDEIAKEIWQRAGSALGTGIANVLTIIGPRRVVLCGGVANAGELLLDPIRRTIEKRVFLMPKEQVEIVLGELGKEAGILGMAQWAALHNPAG